jgi:hypothetical protein
MKINTWVCNQCDSNDETACIINATCGNDDDNGFVPCECPYGLIEPIWKKGRQYDEKPDLIQGYTAEQWQEIIDGRYLCEFAPDDAFLPEQTDIAILKEFYHLEEHPFTVSNGLWKYCRPAQIKGVMRPIFVEPEDKSAWCVAFTSGGVPNEWGAFEHFSKPDSTKYIEV